MGHPIYHFELRAEGCIAELSINGLPVVSVDGSRGEDDSTPPINPYLTGYNQVEIEIQPYDKGEGELSTFSEAKVIGTVLLFEKGDIVGPGGGQVVATFGIPQELIDRVREEELDLPVSYTGEFDNEGPSFIEELMDAEPFEDEEALLDYAVKLRELARAKNLAGIMAEVEPKVAAYAIAYDHDPNELRASLSEFFSGGYFPNEPQVDFEREDVDLSPRCGGRVWELSLGPDTPLFVSAPDADGVVHQMTVLVAPRDGALRIVR